jgi:phosphoesterase RecJ-like protein
VSDGTYERAAALVEKSSRILVTTHTRPDGDACGCLQAMTEVLRELGKTAVPLLLSPMPDWYRFLFAEKVPVLGQDVLPADLTSGAFGPFDLLVVLDTNSYSQLPGLEDYLKRGRVPVLVCDHHVTSDRLGQVEIIDTTAAAAGLVLSDFLMHVGWPITAKVAAGLFVAIGTDTGWFRLRNTDSRVFRRCAELIEVGVDPNGLYHKIYEDFSPARLRLMAAMLNTLELHCDGRYAAQYLARGDFERTGAAYRDTENFVNECQRIGSVEVAALFVELRDGRIRCSLRSRGAVDVSDIARKFGGGGHQAAAGTYVPAPLETAMRLVFEEVATRLS